MKKISFFLNRQRWNRNYRCTVKYSTNSVLDGHVDTGSTIYKERFLKNQQLSNQYNELLARIKAGGGEKAIKRHTEINKKLLVRDRIKLLVDDENDFLEIGSLAGWNMDYGDIPAAGIVVGIAPVSGRLCVILANDATVKGGTIYPIGVKKQLRGQELAKKLNLPCIYVVDSGGAFLPLQSELFPDSYHGGRVFYNQAVMGSEGIPQVAIVCGSCTAGAAYIPTMADNSIIVDRIGSVFLGGPPLVRAALGEIVTTEELGGATLHCKTSGCTDHFAMDERHAVAICREVVSNLNTPVFSRSVKQETIVEPEYMAEVLRGLVGQDVPKKSYIDCILARLLDGSKFAEFRTLYGKSLVAGYGRIGGHLLGIVASIGSPICYRSAQKACQFVQMCSQQNVPILFLQNTMHDGWTDSDSSSLKNIGALMSTVACCESPKITLLIGNGFGSDYFALCGRSFDPTFVFAWPNCCIGLVKPKAKVPFLDCNDPEATSSIEESTAVHAASRLWIDAIILPENTRKVLKMSLDIINQSKNAYAQRDSSILRF